MAKDTQTGEAMRDRIKEVACELLITHGYMGLRFGDIAERLDTTRANVHYHFGKKKYLVDEVIEEYLSETTERFGKVWRSEVLTYREKTLATMEFNRSRFLQFNSDTNGNKPWSLISRMRLEMDLLGEEAKLSLRRFSETMDFYVTDAVLLAQKTGEITADAPAKDIAVQLVAIIDSAGSITQDAGSFDRLSQLYSAYIRVITHAYGGSPQAAITKPDRPERPGRRRRPAVSAPS